MRESVAVTITGIGVEAGGISSVHDLLRFLEAPVSAQAEPELRLGSKGLRYKDRATKLALSAAREALCSAGLPLDPAVQIEPERFGVVVSSNLGNMDTVCRAAQAISHSGVDATSPMDLPNASSNVISASAAIWFGMKAVNLMLCNGATSGTDALRTAANVIRAGRAERMLVIGVETANEHVYRLMRESGGGAEPRLGECAAAVVLESASSAARRGQPILSRIAGYGYHPDGDVWHSIHQASAGTPGIDLWLVPRGNGVAASGWRGMNRPAFLDVTEAFGETYGALGVLQGVAACLWLQAGHGRTAVATTGPGWGDGCASIFLTRREDQ